MARPSSREINWAGWLMTESGHRAYFLQTLSPCRDAYRYACVVTDDEGFQSIETYTVYGQYDKENADSKMNLRNVTAEEWAARRVA